MSDAYYPYQMHLLGTHPLKIQEWYRLKPRNRRGLLWSLEYLTPHALVEIVNMVKVYDTDRSAIWLLQDGFDYHAELKHLLGKQVRYVDFDLHILRLHLEEWRMVKFNPSWNAHTGRFLVLLGKANHASRMRLLWKLQQASLLDRATWSLPGYPDQLAQAREFIPELTDREYKKFVANHVRDPDGAFADLDSELNLHRDGDWFDWRLYRDTSFRIVCETNESTRGIVTEKTWQTMANRQPFLVIGSSPGILDYLRRRGFRTFEEYLPRQTYDMIPDLEQRLDAVVQCTAWLLENMHVIADRVREDVEYNYQRLQYWMQRDWQVIQQVHSELDTSTPAKRLVPLYLRRKKWWEFYYRVRDASWPDCDNEQEFSSLPDHIQRECCEVFGYRPRYPLGIDSWE
jgi:hypothetical protein